MSINLKAKTHSFKTLTHRSKAKGRVFLVKRQGLTVLILLFFLFCMNSYAFAQRQDHLHKFFGIGERDSVRSLVFSPDGEKLAASWYLWDWKNEVSVELLSPIAYFSLNNKYFIDQYTNLYDHSLKKIIYPTFNVGVRPLPFSFDNNYFIFMRSEMISMFTDVWELNLCDIEAQTITKKTVTSSIRPPINILTAHNMTYKDENLVLLAFKYRNKGFVLDDMIDWNSFLHKLKMQDTPSIKRIFSLLDEKSRYMISKWSPELDLDNRSKIYILNDINENVIDSFWMDEPEIFKDIDMKLTKDEKDEFDKFVKYKDTNEIYFENIRSDFHSFNRMLLRKLFDKEIGESRPLYTKIYVYNMNPPKLIKTFYLYNKFIVNMGSTKDTIITVSRFSEDLYSANKTITLLDYETGKQREMPLKEVREYVALSSDGSLASYITDDQDTDYWLLRDEEILNWKGILQKLKQEEEYSVETIFNKLDSDSINFISKLDGDLPLEPEEKKRLLNILNSVLAGGPFVLGWSFGPSFPYSWETKLLYYKLNIAFQSSVNFNKYNRFLFEDIFSQCIKSKKETAQFTIKVHSLEKDEIIQEIKGGPEFERISALVISPDNKYLAAGYLGVEDKMGKVHVYEIETGNLIKTLISPHKFSDN